jgi:hypothetical protein
VPEKAVIDKVYETTKMYVKVGDDTVTKTFKKARNSETRYGREKRAFECFKGLEGFPQLISFDDETFTLVMSRLPGEMPTSLDEDQVIQLRRLVEEMLAQGVARHAIPVRDLLLSDAGQLGMVDFERVSFRLFEISPIWKIGKIVSRYHLSRLINEYQPQMLSGSEKILLNLVNGIRSAGRPIKALKKKVCGLFR